MIIYNTRSVLLFVFLLANFWMSCQSKTNQPEKLFTRLPSDSTGITFSNAIIEDENVNPLQYENSYNGGGVAIGDVNNDGLDDIYLSGNKSGNKLYLNCGHFKFEDITASAGVEGRPGWCTGVTMADVNGDGYLDIYLCHSGNLPGHQRMNELFINKGKDSAGRPSFTEMAQSFGLADSAFSTQAAFLDYDLDGDLDMVLLNHSPIRFNNMDQATIKYLLNKSDSLTGLKLYRNDHGYFKDVTRESGLRNARLNFNLGVSVSDINSDGLPDIYVSNDYLAPDCMYINQGNGIFKDETEKSLSATSEFSMGLDVADVNNDGLPDIYTLDMLPEDNHRQKLLFASDNYERFNLNVKAGLHRQYMRNMLHLNNGNGSFSEIGQFANISNTDWSWAPLFADFDNDGWKDLFVSNGYLRDYTNMDFLKFMGDYVKSSQAKIQKEKLLELVKKMPSSDVKNYAFQNNHDLSFMNKSAAWGLDAVSNSGGAAYADLDNDGDIDLVVNNINQPAFIYRNNSDARSSGNHYIKVTLLGTNQNKFGVGAKVVLHINGQKICQEQLMTRGFQSSVSPVLVFGTGKSNTIDSIEVIWPGGLQQILKSVSTGQELLLKQTDATMLPAHKQEQQKTLLSLLPESPVTFIHHQEPINDFKRQPLLINQQSDIGPCMAKGDLNADGKDDLFIGGSPGNAGAIYLQGKDNKFTRLKEPALESSNLYADASAVIFDANGDGSPDLFVASGGYSFLEPGAAAFENRLYLNDGHGYFRKANSAAIPAIFTSCGTVAAGDINQDGFIDLFLGGRVVPGRYPEAPRSYILMNDGKGVFSDQTNVICPSLSAPGMISSAVFADMDGDKKLELVTAGEWMPVQIWKSVNGKLLDRTTDFIDANESGWWSSIAIKDINGDGKPDLIAGNYGLNCQWKATSHQPLEMYYDDFDENGSIDPIFCYYIQGKCFPYVSRDELLDQMSVMRTRFPDYKSYADAGINDIFSPTELKHAVKLTARTTATKVWISNPTGKLTVVNLPPEAQFSPVFSIAVTDFNGDGYIDLLLGGNISNSRIKIGINESNKGQLFLGNGHGQFQYVPQWSSGLNIRGQIRSLCVMDNVLLVGINGDAVCAYQFVK